MDISPKLELALIDRQVACTNPDCYAKFRALDILKFMDDEEKQALIRWLERMGHQPVLAVHLNNIGFKCPKCQYTPSGVPAFIGCAPVGSWFEI